MSIVFTLDKKDYEPGQEIFEKITTRAVIIRDGRIAMQKGSAGDYKLLGGGVEPGEDLKQALMREVREESGLIVLSDTIEELGEVTEKRRDAFLPEKIFVCHSYFFGCSADEKTAQTALTASEIEKGYHLVWATMEEIIEGNRPFFESQPWIYRDTEFLKRMSYEDCP